MKENKVLRLDESSAEAFCRLRMELFAELGEISENQDVSELKEATERYYRSHINKDLISWGIFQEGSLAAAGSLCLFFRLPYAENLSGQEGYILNIYTSPLFRRQGYANAILDEIIAFAKDNQIKRLWLNSSEQGEELYGRRGFAKKENEMELFLPLPGYTLA